MLKESQFLFMTSSTGKRTARATLGVKKKFVYLNNLGKVSHTGVKYS